MSTKRNRRALRAAGAATALGAVAAGGALAFAPSTSTASSHREAPLTAANPLVDNTDTYAFVSPDKPDTVTLIANWIPFQDPAGGPNFFPFGAEGYRYNIKIDNNGDAKPDVTYRWTFQNQDARAGETFLYNNGPVNSIDDATLLFKQTYTLEKIDAAGTATTIVENGKVAPSRVGDASMPNYAALRDEAIVPTTDGGTTFSGQADDPFFLDLRVFDLLYGGDLSESGNASLSGYNVNAIALQVPFASVTEGGDDSGIIGVWSTTDQQTMTLSAGKAEPTGDFVQVSRLGAPLVNEVVLPASLKDAFNGLNPEQDGTVMAAVDRVKDPEVPKLIEKIYGIKGLNQPPKVTPAELLRLNLKTPVAPEPNRLGVLAKDTAGFPNGRRLADDVVDIELQALEGAITQGIVKPLAKGDGVNANDVEFGNAFPYLALPHSGSATSARGTSGKGAATLGGGSAAAATAPQGGVRTGAGGTAPGGLPALPVTAGLLVLAAAGAGIALQRRTA